MTITLYCIGFLKEDYWTAACNEYLKRIGKYSKIVVKEFSDVSYKEGDNEEKIKNQECLNVLSNLKPNEFLVGLDLGRKEITSVELSKNLNKWFVKGGSNISFVVGGSLGLSDELKKRCNDFLCLSQLTLPHQLARVVFLEQIYRAFKIEHNEPYHK